MKKITRMTLFIFLTAVIFGIAGPATAQFGGGGYDDYNSPKLMVGPHPRGETPNVFAGGLPTVSDAVLYTLALKTTKGDIRVDQILFSFALSELNPRQIGNLRLVLDANGNGKFDAGDKTLGRATLVTDDRLGALYAKPFTVRENETLCIMLVADIKEAAISAQLLVKTDEASFAATGAEGKRAQAQKFGALPTVKHVLESPMAMIALAPAENKIVGNRVTLEGHLYYRNGVSVNEDMIGKTAIEGWRIVKVVLGREEGVDSHRRYISFVLELPDKSRAGTYKIPSFNILFLDLDQEKEKYISTPVFTVEKTNLLVKSEIFPQVVTMGERFRYRIEFIGLPEAGISNDFLSDLKLQKKLGSFDVEQMNMTRNKGEDLVKIEIILTLSVYDYPGQTMEVPALEIPYFLSTATGAEVLVYKLPAVKVAITSLMTDKTLSFRPLADKNDPVSGDGWGASPAGRKTVRLIVLAACLLLVGQYPWRFLKTMRRKNEPLLAKQRAKRMFRYCSRVYPTAERNVDNLRRFYGAFSGYLRALCEVKADTGSLGFGLALKEKCPPAYDFWEKLQDKLFHYDREIESTGIDDRAEFVAQAAVIIAELEKGKK